MGIKLYLAGSHSTRNEPIFRAKGVRRLYSQVNDRKLGEEWIEYSKNVEHRDIFVDSGAYTCHTKGVELDVDEYIQYLNERQGGFSAIAQVDKIPGEFKKKKTLQQLKEAPELSWENYLYMRERVIDKDCLLPIFHQGEDMRHLHRMLEWTDENGKHIPYIGISSANDVSTKMKDKWFSTVFRIIKNSSNPNVKTHAFGMTSTTVLEKYPFYSADSTNWLLSAAYGRIFTPYGTYSISDVSIDSKDHISYLTDTQLNKIEEQLKRYDITIDDCRNEFYARGLNNALFITEWAENYEYKGTHSFQGRLF